jgi:hypothetical protein
MSSNRDDRPDDRGPDKRSADEVTDVELGQLLGAANTELLAHIEANADWARVLTEIMTGGTRVETEDNWRKPSYSGANGRGECVEVASTPAAVMVRDTRDRSGHTLSVPASAWRAFISTVK